MVALVGCGDDSAYVSLPHRLEGSPGAEDRQGRPVVIVGGHRVHAFLGVNGPHPLGEFPRERLGRLADGSSLLPFSLALTWSDTGGESVNVYSAAVRQAGQTVPCSSDEGTHADYVASRDEAGPLYFRCRVGHREGDVVVRYQLDGQNHEAALHMVPEPPTYETFNSWEALLTR